MTNAPSTAADVPEADVQPVRHGRWVWVIPVLALFFAAGLYVVYAVKRGPVIAVSMSHGHGIKVNAVLRCRGIVVGEVVNVRLSQGLDGVDLQVRLDPAAAEIARAGSRFWVVRPRVGLTGVGGLETIAGPHYLAVVPGKGPRQPRFVAHEHPPAVEVIDPNGLEIELSAERRGSLRSGAPITYRQVHIGKVLSVGLSADAASVQVRAYIEPHFAALVRDNSKFWNVSGVDLNLGIKGLRLGIESLQALLDGGVALATPDTPGKRVGTGHRFTLHDGSDDAWLQWRPRLPVGTAWLAPGADRPRMLRVMVTTQTRRLVLTSTQQHKGWVLSTPQGIVGPAGLISDQGENAVLEVAGQRFALADQEARKMGRLVLLAIQPDERPAKPLQNVRRMDTAEDCLVMIDAASPVIPLAAARLNKATDHWSVDSAISLDQDLNGAAVLARRDGSLVGLLLVEEGVGQVVAAEWGDAGD